MEIIPVDWYIETPIDFEHKQYVLFDYLQKVDNSFYKKMLSPHLLHMEKMVKELMKYQSSFDCIKNNFDKNRYIYFHNPKLENEDNKLIDEINEIVHFSLPQIKTRIEYGYIILKKNKQVLF